MLEGTFTRKLIKELKHHPALANGVVVKLSDRFTSGIPDFIVNLDGRTVWFEVKMDPERPEKIQRYWLERLRPSYVIIASKDGKRVWFEHGASDFQNAAVFGLDVKEFADHLVRTCL